MRKIIVFVGVILLLLGIIYCFAQDQVTVTTYYPSPHGVYRILRLSPIASPGLPCQDGEMYYDSGTDKVTACANGIWVALH